ncbi:MAG: hypothetical protein IKD04_01790 [Clostridia bacterium]|nr:hypothetical protein [Clostridia bacterium]
MEQRSLKSLTSEKDLKIYEDYLQKNGIVSKSQGAQIITKPKMQIEAVNNSAVRRVIPETLTNPVFFQGYLKNHIGKLIRVESLIGECLESRTGILFEVGDDYIVIKLNKSCCSMLIKACTIKYITIVHDNDIRKALI